MATWTAATRRAYLESHPENFAGEGDKYPIKDGNDVKSAWDLAGRASDPDAVRRKVKAIAKRLGLSGALPDTATESKEAAVTPMSSTFLIDIRNAPASADGSVPVLLVAAGESKGVNGPVDYQPDVLMREAGKFDGVKVFDNHQSDKEEATKPYRSIKEHWATIRNTRFDTTPRDDAPQGGIVGDMQMHDPWFADRVKTAPDTVKLSIRASGTGKKEQRGGKQVAVLEAFRAVKSCDAVTDAGAGGQILSLREAAAKEEATMLVGDLTPEDVKANAVLWQGVIALAAKESKIVADYQDQYQGDDAKAWEKRMAESKRDNDQSKHDKLLDKMPSGVEHDRDQCPMCRGDVTMQSKETAVTTTTPAAGDATALQLKETQGRLAALEARWTAQETTAQRQAALAAKVHASTLPKLAQDEVLADLKEASLPVEQAAFDQAVDARITRMQTFVQKFGGARITGMGQTSDGAPLEVKEAVKQRIEAKFGNVGLPQGSKAPAAATTDAAARLAAKI